MRTFEMLPDLGRLFAQMTPGDGRVLRALIANKQARTEMPGPARPEFLEFRIEEALVPYPTLRYIGPPADAVLVAI